MRFQSSDGALLNAIGPTLSVVNLNVPTGTGTVILPTPPANFYYIIYNITLNAATSTTGGTANMRAATHTTGTYICGSYNKADGLWVNWTGNLAISEGLDVGNTTGQIGGVHVFYQTASLSPF